MSPRWPCNGWGISRANRATSTLRSAHCGCSIRCSRSIRTATCTSLLLALEEAIAPPRVVVLRGPAEQMHEWRRSLDRADPPTTVILAIVPGEAELPPLLAKPAVFGAVNAWVCQGVTCLPAVDKLESLLELLNIAKIG